MGINPNNKNIILPANAQLSINHCNLSARILGGLTYNEHPVPLELDGVNELHNNLFWFLKPVVDLNERRNLFDSYMNAHFQLEYNQRTKPRKSAVFNRDKINYKRIILGWHMNPDSIEGAVLKRWAESRFGLLPRYHKTKIRHYTDPAYETFLYESSVGIYNTNAVESQLDVLYVYSQYELQQNQNTHIRLYRGINQLDQHEILFKNRNDIVVLLNNIFSFSYEKTLAEQFGDYVLAIDVPIYKIFSFNKILPKQINSEEEYIVIGGLYRATIV